jgi:transposase-like protein
MEAREVLEEILSKVFKWYRFPVSLKAEAVLLYFKGLSLRAVRECLPHKGYKVSIETLREWFHAVGRALQAVYTIAIWVYVDETKIKARYRTYLVFLNFHTRTSYIDTEYKPQTPVYPPGFSFHWTWTGNVL